MHEESYEQDPADGGLDVEIVVDEQMPPDVATITVRGSELRVTVSPRVEANVLFALSDKIADEIAAFIDAAPWKEGEE